MRERRESILPITFLIGSIQSDTKFLCCLVWVQKDQLRVYIITARINPVPSMILPKLFFSEAKAFGLKTPSRINSIKTTECPSPAVRPAYSVSDCSKIESSFGMVRSNWRHWIRQILDKLHGQR